MRTDKIIAVRIVLRVYEKEFPVDAGYSPVSGLYHVGGWQLTEPELRDMVQREHGCELVSIIHEGR